MKMDGCNSTEFRVAKETDCTVLITGPTGAGKSRLAAKIHQLGIRSQASFISVHLSSMHEGTLESQLFGHERGAFTGAFTRQMGWLQKAHNGTLFLDEIAELSLGAQARLLEFLQTKRITPLGSRVSVDVDARIICATNKDLAEEVRIGNFRADLYHRMRIITIDLPPLRGALEVFDEVVHGLITELSKQHGRRLCRIEPPVAGLLEAYSWPGNYRELRNVLEFAILASGENVIREVDLPTWFRTAAQEEKAGLTAYFTDGEPIIETHSSSDTQAIHSIAKVLLQDDYEATMQGFERAFIRAKLRECAGQITKAAARLKLPKSTLSRRAKALGIESRRRPKPVNAVQQKGPDPDEIA